VAADRNLEDVSQFVVSLPAGEFVFRERDRSRELFLVQEGKVELLKRRAGEDRQIELLEIGDFFGEWSLLEGQPREVSARALTACQLLRIDGPAFAQLVAEDPDIAIRMLRKLLRRLRERTEADQRAAEIASNVLSARRLQESVSAPAPVPSGPPVLVHKGSGTEFPLAGKTEASVGRLDRSTGQAPDVDLSAFDTERTLSRRHARLVALPDGRWAVREESGARNGTFVNGQRVKAGADVPIAHGDRLQFGAIETILRWA
jgi:hypothetical protein